MDSSPDEILQAIESARKGATYITPALAQKLVLEVGVERKEEEPHKAVSKREFQVMALIGSGKTLREISEELNISTKTVSVHRDRILKKMKMKHNTELIRYVLEKGIVE
jgi:DNA-binding NarL/FixJ family response regulator